MTRIDAYLQPNRHSTPTAATRSASVYAWILQNASSIVIDREGVLLPAQTVRIESGSANEVAAEPGKAAKRKITVFGVVGHPTVADTDMRRGDRFSYNATPTGRLNYRIIHVDLTQIGQSQSEAEEIS